MKYTRYIVSFILMLFSIFSSIEILNVLFMSDKGSVFECADKYKNDYSWIGEYVKYAEKPSECGFFIEESISESLLSTSVRFYCYGNAEEEIRRKIYVPDGEVTSLLYNNIKAEFCNINTFNEFECKGELYFTGENRSELDKLKKDIESFTGILLDVSEISEKGSIARYFICKIPWIIYLIITLFFNLFDVAYFKRNKCIKILYGESVSAIIRTRLFVDLIVSVIFLAADYVILPSASYRFVLKDSAVAAIVWVCADMFITVRNAGVKEDEVRKLLNKGAVNSGKIVKICCAVRFIVITIISLVLTCIIISAFPLIQYLKADSIISQYKDYGFAEWIYDFSSDADGLQKRMIMNRNSEQVYREYFEKCQILVCAENTNVVYANPNSYEYLNQIFPEFKCTEAGKDLYIFVPDSSDESDEEILEKSEFDIFMLEGGEFQYTYEVVRYKSYTEMIVFDKSNYQTGLGFVKNPYVVYNSIDPSTLTTDINGCSKLFISQSFLYKFGDENALADEIVSRYGYKSVTVTNIYELYTSYIRKNTRLLIMFLVSAVYLVFLYIMILITTVNAEYEVTGREKIIRKIYGHSFYEIYVNELTVAALLNLLSMFFVTILYNIILSQQQITFFPALISFIAGMTGLFIEMILIFRNEKKNISKILKGSTI